MRGAGRHGVRIPQSRAGRSFPPPVTVSGSFALGGPDKPELLERGHAVV